MAHGHSFESIKGYTLRQVRAFLASIERHKRELRLGDAIAMRMAQAPGKSWKRYINGLKGK